MSGRGYLGQLDDSFSPSFSVLIVSLLFIILLVDVDDFESEKCVCDVEDDKIYFSVCSLCSFLADSENCSSFFCIQYI